MFRDTIEGLERIFETDIKSRKTILVVGGGGTMKTTFVYNLLALRCDKADEKALYVTLEENERSILENTSSIGLPLSKNIHIVDYNVLRAQFKDKEKDLDFIYVLETLIKSFKTEFPEKFKYLAIDSLGALYSLIKISELRSDVYHFFNIMKEYNLTGLIIAEETPTEQAQFGYEDFLTDGVIEMGIIETGDGQVKRIIQVRKMRTVRHSMEKYIFEAGDGGLKIIGNVREVLGGGG